MVCEWEAGQLWEGLRGVGEVLPSCLLFVCAGLEGPQQQEHCWGVVFGRPLSHSSLQLISCFGL